MRTTIRIRQSLVVLAVPLLIGAIATACGGEDDEEAASPSPSPTTAGIEESVEAYDVPEQLKTKPTPQTQQGSPAPADLQIIDVIQGTGAEAKAGDTVVVNYVGVLLADGTEFDASWDRNQPFDFVLGQGQVIQGWDEGVVGMKVGGRRELVIPPGKAYGSTGAGGVIPPDATLVFVVDLLAVR